MQCKCPRLPIPHRQHPACEIRSSGATRIRRPASGTTTTLSTCSGRTRATTTAESAATPINGKRPRAPPLEKKDVGSAIHDESTRLPDGINYTFNIRACDGKLNWNKTAATYGPISIDTTPPKFLKVTINDGAEYTNNPNVTLSLCATELQPASGLGSMSISNDGKKWSDWIPFCNTLTGWDLTDSRFGGDNSDGAKTVYFKAGTSSETRYRTKTPPCLYLPRQGRPVRPRAHHQRRGRIHKRRQCEPRHQGHGP